jgi:sporulation protein YlmC with PRC-barrel domain
MRRPEQTLQRTILSFIHAQYPRALVFHVPNGGKRGKIEAAIMKSLGVRAGVADLCLHWRGGHTGYLELKSEKGRLSQHQKQFANECAALDIPWACVKSIDEIQSVLKSWGVQ